MSPASGPSESRPSTTGPGRPPRPTRPTRASPLATSRVSSRTCGRFWQMDERRRGATVASVPSGAILSALALAGLTSPPGLAQESRVMLVGGRRSHHPGDRRLCRRRRRRSGERRVPPSDHHPRHSGRPRCVDARNRPVSAQCHRPHGGLCQPGGCPGGVGRNLHHDGGRHRGDGARHLHRSRHAGRPAGRRDHRQDHQRCRRLRGFGGRASRSQCRVRRGVGPGRPVGELARGGRIWAWSTSSPTTSTIFSSRSTA